MLEDDWDRSPQLVQIVRRRRGGRRRQEEAGAGVGQAGVEAGVEGAQAGGRSWGGGGGGGGHGQSVLHSGANLGGLGGRQAGELGQVVGRVGEPGVGGEVGGARHHLVERGELLQLGPGEVAQRELVAITLQGLRLPSGSVFILRVISHVLRSDSFGLINIWSFLYIS